MYQNAPNSCIQIKEKKKTPSPNAFIRGPEHLNSLYKKKQERDKLQWNKDEEEIKHQSIIEPL